MYEILQIKFRAIDPFMGELPEARVTEATPYVVTEMDYAGPFLLKNDKGLIYLLFCKIHLEIVIDLSTKTFIAAVRRFFLPLDIFGQINEFIIFFNTFKDEIIQLCIDLNID